MGSDVGAVGGASGGGGRIMGCEREEPRRLDFCAERSVSGWKGGEERGGSVGVTPEMTERASGDSACEADRVGEEEPGDEEADGCVADAEEDVRDWTAGSDAVETDDCWSSGGGGLEGRTWIDG